MSPGPAPPVDDPSRSADAAVGFFVANTMNSSGEKLDASTHPIAQIRFRRKRRSSLPGGHWSHPTSLARERERGATRGAIALRPLASLHQHNNVVRIDIVQQRPRTLVDHVGIE